MSQSDRTHRVSPLAINDTVLIHGQSSDREQVSPRAKPAFQRQCSSPSFVESYARYVERLQQDDMSKQQGKPGQEEQGTQEQTIKAAFPGEAQKERSPDSDKDVTDSSYSSWPGPARTLKTLLVCQS